MKWYGIFIIFGGFVVAVMMMIAYTFLHAENRAGKVKFLLGFF